MMVETLTRLFSGAAALTVMIGLFAGAPISPSVTIESVIVGTTAGHRAGVGGDHRGGGAVYLYHAIIDDPGRDAHRRLHAAGLYGSGAKSVQHHRQSDGG